MTTRIEIGAGTRPPDRLEARLSVAFREIESSGENPLRTATVRRWRSKAGGSWSRWSMVALHWLVDDPLKEREAPTLAGAEHGWGLLRPTDANALLWERFLHPFGEEGPPRVLFRTPASFTPSMDNREALKTVATTWCGPRNIVMEWEPRGLWTPEEVATLSAELGMQAVFDPFGDTDFPPDLGAPVIFALDRPRGGRARFTEDDCMDLLEHVGERSAPTRLIVRGPLREQTLGLLRRTLRFVGLQEASAQEAVAMDRHALHGAHDEEDA